MSVEMVNLLLLAMGQTIYMTLVSGFLSVLFGLPLGVLLYVTRKNRFLAAPRFHQILSAVVNALRSIPFIILLVALIPVTRFLVGTSIGTNAAIVPLTIGAIPFVGRIVENALSEVSFGLIEAGMSMGATPLQLVTKILIPEALPAIVNGITVTLVTLVSFSAMAGVVGGGGLGDLAIRYGYQRFDLKIMLITIVFLIVIVQILQLIGERISRYLAHHS